MSLYEHPVYLTWKQATAAWTQVLAEHITARTREVYPTAAALLIEVTYGDEGDMGVAAQGVRDAEGNVLADNDEHLTPEFDTLADDLWEPLNNLNDLDPIVITSDEGELEFEPKEA